MQCGGQGSLAQANCRATGASKPQIRCVQTKGDWPHWRDTARSAKPPDVANVLSPLCRSTPCFTLRYSAQPPELSQCPACKATVDRSDHTPRQWFHVPISTNLSRNTCSPLPSGFASRTYNALMRALNGNTVHHDDQARISTYKSNGLSAIGRWQQILDRDFDICILTETHCSEKLQKSLAIDTGHFHLIWGTPVPETSRAGVMCIARRRKVRAVKAQNFLRPDCNPFHTQGRLILVQAYRGKGNRPFLLIYGIYGFSGARSDGDKKKQFHAMFKAICADLAMRGPQIACLIGDFNIQPSESERMQTYLRAGFLYDAYCWQSATTASGATCHKGASSRIDLILMNQQASTFCNSYHVLPGLNKKDHSEVQTALRIPLHAQHSKKVYTTGSNLTYDRPPADYIEPVEPSHYNPTKLLSQHNLDTAWHYWSQKAERCLKQIPQTLEDQVTYDTGSRRGHIRLHKQVLFPKVVHGTVQSLKTKRLSQALARAEELRRSCAFGHAQQSKPMETISELLSPALTIINGRNSSTLSINPSPSTMYRLYSNSFALLCSGPSQPNNMPASRRGKRNSSTAKNILTNGRERHDPLRTRQ